ncbi:MAG TPA: tetratricopeptide repeat protein [Gemmatimonadaceae bacterium]|nr:tetratricopeptide repeat protein [Gemmatimonadaceae bacterium]
MTISAKRLIARTTGAAAVALTTVSCADATSVTSPRIGASPFTPTATSIAACSAEQGQQLIDAGQYKQAIQKFTCVIDRDPTAVEGYRGRIEAELMLGWYSDALRDYTRVTAFVLPVHPDAEQVIVNGYMARLAVAPAEVTALVGLSFAHWYGFDYPAAIHVLDDLLEAQANHVYGNLFRGSSRVLQGAMRAAGAADLDRAIALSPSSPDVRFIVADAYTYGALPNPQRAFDEATFALQGGLDTPRVRAIRASSYIAFGDVVAAAHEIKRHLDLVTTELVATSPLGPVSTTTLGLVPGRTYEIPIAAGAGETISIATSSKDFWDTILVLLAPDGSPVVGSDDEKGYFAGIEWAAPSAGT